MDASNGGTVALEWELVVRFQILGSLEVRNGDGAVALGGMQERSLLAILLLHPNQLLDRAVGRRALG
jgi:hypothetical protein